MPADDAIYPSLRDRAVLVTGGASGIGASIVSHFAAQGARVAFLDIADDAAVALCARIAEARHPVPRYIHCDLTDIEALRAAIAEIGPVAVLVNNAAHDQRHAWQEVTPEYWDNRQAVNLRHQFFAIQAVAPGMIAQGFGSILNFGSTSWRNAVGGMPGYTSAKAAVEGLTRGMARDLGPHRIRVNSVIPGWVMTERQLRLWVTADSEAAIASHQCLPDRLMPEDLARMVLWLAADDSRMCTAQCFVVDAGWS